LQVLFELKGPTAEELEMGDLHDLLGICPNLASLRLESVFNLSNTLPRILNENVPCLSRLEVPGCHISDAFILKVVTNLNLLRHLDVSYTQVSLKLLPLIIERCVHLETLDMSGCQQTENYNTDFKSNNLLSDKFKSPIRQLSLALTDPSDSLVILVTRICPKLEILLLTNCKRLTDSCLSAIARNCSMIKELDISHCELITDAGVQSLALHFSNYKHFRL
jgi:Leucine-rich repeat (LRR) protein